MIERLDVHVAAAPVPGLLRPAIEAALGGGALGAGPETDVGRAVAQAVGRASGPLPGQAAAPARGESAC